MMINRIIKTTGVLCLAVMFCAGNISIGKEVQLEIDQFSVQVPQKWAFHLTESNAEFIPLKIWLTRSWQLQHPRVKGGTLRYKLILKQPVLTEQVLEFEYPGIVKKVYADNNEVQDISAANLGTGKMGLNKTTGRCFLIPSGTHIITYDVADFPFRFNNHTGQVILRSLMVNDRFILNQKITDVQEKFHIDVTIRNRAKATPLEGKLSIVTEDRFGNTIRSNLYPVNMLNSSKMFTEKRQSLEDYKLVVKFIDKTGEEGLVYWSYFRDGGIFENAKLLDWNWSAKWVPKKVGLSSLPDNSDWFSNMLDQRPGIYKKCFAPGLPFISIAKDKPYRVWLKNKFFADSSWQGKNITLFLRSILYHGEFYLNGVKIGEKHNRDLPGELNLTPYLKFGKENELLIGVTGVIANFDPNMNINDGEKPRSGLLDSGPSRPESHQYDKIGLRETPIIRVQDIISLSELKIHSQVDSLKRTVLSEFNLINHTDMTQKIRLTVDIYDKGKKVLNILQKKQTIPASGSINIKTNKNFSKAKLWSLHKPNLYELRITIIKNGEPLTIKRERFGVCQWGRQDDDFTLNGEKVMIHGQSQLYLHFWNPNANLWPIIPTNIKATRWGDHGLLQQGLNIADELGFASTLEMPVSPYGQSRIFNYGDKRLFVNLKSKISNLVSEYRNHPAVFAYTMGNEPPTINPEWCENMADLERYTCTLDPNRFAFHSRGNDLLGKSEMYVPHYTYHRNIFPTDLNLIDSTIADKRLLRQATHNDSYEKPWLHRKKGKIFFDSEGSLISDGAFFPWRYGEEVLVVNPETTYEAQGYLHGRDAMRAYQYDSFRKNRINIMTHIGYRVGDDALTDVAAVLYAEEYRLFSGKKAKRTICVMNDSVNSEKVKVIATLIRESGDIDATFTKTFTLNPIEHSLWDIQLPAIQVKKPEHLTLKVVARGMNSESKRHYTLTVFPENITINYPSVKLFDPDGYTANAFAHSKFNIETIDSLDKLDGANILIVGRNMLSKLDSIKINKLVNGGLKVLVLQQHNFTWGFPFELVDVKHISNGAGAIISSPHHPVFKNLLAEDLRYWQNKNRVPVVFENAPLASKPHEQQYLLMGQRTSLGEMNYTPLFTHQYGKGIYMVSALSFSDSLPYDPAPQLLMRNMLDYLSGCTPKATSGAVIMDNIHISILKAQYGVIPEKNAYVPGKTKNLAVLGNSTALPEEVEQMVKKGGILYIHQPDTKRLTELQKKFGLKTSTDDYKLEFTNIALRDPLFEGLTQADFMWPGPEPLCVRRPKVKNKDNLLGEKVFKTSEQVTAITTPAYLVNFKYGKGRIVLDNSRWNTAKNRHAKTLGTAILHNLGLNLHYQAKEKNQIPSWKFNFFPINISSALNLPLIDEYPKDKKGGWNDDGSSKDLRSLKPGKHILHGVPMTSYDKAVTVKGPVWKDKPEVSKEIKIDRNLDKIFFFHCSSYTSIPKGEEIGRYRIYYEDRNTWIPGKNDPFVTVPIRHMHNICDWWGMNNIDEGEITLPQATIAWRGTGIERNRGFFFTEWNNPFPNRKINAIVLESATDKGQIFMLGATGATHAKHEEIKVQLINKLNSPIEMKQIRGLYGFLKLGRYTVYVDGASRIVGIYTQDGKQVFGSLGLWLLQYRLNGESKINNYIAYASQKNLKAVKIGDDSYRIEIQQVNGEFVQWSQIFTITGDTLDIHTKYILTPEFKKNFENSNHVGIQFTVELPDTSDLKLTNQGQSLIQAVSNGLNYSVNIDPMNRRMTKDWYLNKNLLRLKPENFTFKTAKLETGYELNLSIKLDVN